MSSSDEKDYLHADHIEATVPKDTSGTLRDAALPGHAATDKLGYALISIDPKASARLRLKLDLYLLPTLFFLYLFCFVDRANIGEHTFRAAVVQPETIGCRQCKNRWP